MPDLDWAPLDYPGSRTMIGCPPRDRFPELGLTRSLHRENGGIRHGYGSGPGFLAIRRGLDLKAYPEEGSQRKAPERVGPPSKSIFALDVA